MEIEFSDKRIFPLLSSYGRNEEITSGTDMVKKPKGMCLNCISVVNTYLW